MTWFWKFERKILYSDIKTFAAVSTFFKHEKKVMENWKKKIQRWQEYLSCKGGKTRTERQKNVVWVTGEDETFVRTARKYFEVYLKLERSVGKIRKRKRLMEAARKRLATRRGSTEKYYVEWIEVKHEEGKGWKGHKWTNTFVRADGKYIWVREESYERITEKRCYGKANVKRDANAQKSFRGDGAKRSPSATRTPSEVYRKEVRKLTVLRTNAGRNTKSLKRFQGHP